MSTPGEAASLFGTPDSAPDPFSAALGGETQDEPSSHDAPAANAVSDLFGSATEDFPLDGASSSDATQQDAQQAWYDPAAQQSYSYDTAATSGYAQSYQSQPSYAQTNGTYSQYAQYGQHGQSSAYIQPAASTTSTYEPTYTPQTSYAPQTYAPSYSQTASPYVPASTAQQAPVTQNGTYSAPSYDPYKPAKAQPSYEPAAQATSTPAPVQSTYDPYKPSYNAAPAQAQTHSYATNSHTSAYAPPVAVPAPPAPLVAAPPPPAPAVSIDHYRPKTLNAYDPPIPPLKVKHVTVPPRPVYSTPTPPPFSPPPRTTLTPQSIAPPPKGPPRRTPDPHAVSPRRDSYTSSTVNGSSHHAVGPSPYAPPAAPAANGATYNPYQPSHTSQTSHDTTPPAHAPYGGAGQNGGYLPEGLPKVNDTFAPTNSTSQYTAGLPQHSDPFGASTHHSSPIDHASPKSDGPAERVASPLRDAIPEVDEEGMFDGAEEADVTPFAASSPPTTTGLGPAVGSTWPNQAAHPPPSHGPSSPDRTLSPPRASSAAPPPVSHIAPPRASSAAPQTSYDPYAPSVKSNVSDRAKFPGASSVRSVASVPKNSYDPPMPPIPMPPRRDSASTNISPTLSRPLSSMSRRSTLSSSYEPAPASELKRTASPSGSIRSVTAPKQNAYDPYAPADKSAGPSTHGRSTSNGSTYSTTSVADPYAPTRHPVRTSSEHQYSSFALPATTYAPNGSGPAVPPVPTYDRTGAQVVTLAAPLHSTYAPSPSLLGTNDPLGRTSARVPVISFGFGGKLVTCFHGANMHTGFDVALSARQSTDIKIHSLNKVIPESALDTSATSFPGPLYSDPGSPTASLVRTGAQAQKAKKAKVIKYLEDRAEEMAAGLGYHRPGTVDRSRAEAKRILVLLLKVMVENDGRLSGSPQIDSAVRTALAPHDGVSPSNEAPLAGGTGMIPATSAELLSSGYSLSSSIPNLQDETVSKTVVRASQLDKIQELLAKGDRRGACHYAADEKIWSHALLIASSIDKECWKEVVTEWIRAELVSDEAQVDVTNGREPLRVAYSLFGGNGASAVQELVHPKSLLQHNQNSLQIPQPQMTVTPMTPNFNVSQPLNISQEVLANWAKTAAMILTNPLTPDSSAALTALGDQLAAHQWTEAAHACYMLSPQTSPLNFLGTPRLTLLGSLPPTASPLYYKDSDPVILSEILEFAMSLATPAKGQEPFAGFPHLQPYRLLHATSLAELGHVQLATRYCEAITACISRGSPHQVNVAFVEQLKSLTDRLIAAPQLDKSGSWIGGKMAKPSLDSIGNWLEGRFTKFIAGEGDSPRPEEAKGMAQQQAYTGPFANYSSISSATTSAYPSPHQSVTDLTDVSGPPAPPFRTGSAMANRPPSRTHIQINRAASAMDNARTPYGNGYTPGSDHLRAGSKSHGDVYGEGQHAQTPSTASSWGWGASESDVSTPTASTFVHMDDGPSSGTSNSEFISLMDSPMLSATPTASKQQDAPASRPAHNDFDDDDDDLGLGNASHKKATKAENGNAGSDAPAKEEEKPKAAETKKPELQQTPSSGWLSRFWKRSDSTSPAPVKANLGEESSFYYDKELKRWVNKTAGGEAPKGNPPPPPPRAQTASPGRQLGAGPPPPSPLGPPPPRPATAHPIDLSTEPPRRPPTRARSNLVPSDAEGIPSAPPSPLPPTASGTPPPGNGPPRGGARGGGPKRNLRSRYVDVFQQEGAAS